MEDTAVELKITFLKSEKGRKRGLQTKTKKNDYSKVFGGMLEDATDEIIDYFGIVKKRGEHFEKT